MKNKFILILFLVGCSSSIGVDRDSIVYLFPVENCKLYRLTDDGERHYFTVCPPSCNHKKREPRIIPDMGYKN